MSERYTYKIKPFKSSMLDKVWISISILFIFIWTSINVYFVLTLLPITIRELFITIFYSIIIYSSLFYMLIHSWINIKRSREYLYIYDDRFELPKTNIFDFLKKENIKVRFKDILKHRYIWYGAGCLLYLKNNKEVLISPENYGVEGYIKICELLEKMSPSDSKPNMNLVKKWMEMKKRRWKRRREERELFNKLKEKNSRFV